MGIKHLAFKVCRFRVQGLGVECLRLSVWGQGFKGS